MNREQFIDGLFDVELQDQLLREDLGNLAQAVARAQAMDLVNKSSRARERKRLHLACVAQGIPEPTAEPSVGSGLSGRALTNWTDPRIDQLVSAQGDLLTQMQNMTAMMGRFVNSVITATHPENPPRQE